MEDRVEVFEDLLNAPLRILKWQILSNHSQLWSEYGMAWLRKEKEKAWEKKDFERIQKLSSKILLFERCREAGAETAFFGKVLDEAHRAAVEKEVPPTAAEQAGKAVKFRNDGKWDKAITIFERLLEELDDNENPLTAEIQHRLGDILWKSPKGDRAENLEKAIEFYGNALEVRTREDFPENWARNQHNLANAYRARIRGDRVENLEKAIELYNEALEIRVPQTFPRKCRETSMKLSEAEMERRRWKDVLVSADRARHADRILVRAATSVTGKIHEIEESAALYYHASLACARLGDVTGSVEWLEQGKTRELGESLARDRALFRHVIRGEDRDEYLRIQEKLRVLEAEQRGAVPGARSFTEVAEDARNTHETLDTLIGRIQQYEPEFLRETTIARDEILSLLTGETRAYVIFNVTEFGTAVILLAVAGGSPVAETFFNEDFTTETMEMLTGRWSKGLAAMRRGEAVMGEGQMKWWSEIDDIGRNLYRNLFSLVHEWLREKAEDVRELVFVPHLSLQIFPFHLMRYDNEEEPAYLMQDYDVSFAPSLTVILEKKGIKKRPKAPRLEHESPEPAASPMFLLVSDPTGDLRYAEEEVKGIESILSGERRILRGKDTSVEKLLETASGVRYLHLSCHGEFDPVEPWNSGLILAPDREEESGGDAEEELLETVCTRDSAGRVWKEVRSLGDAGEEHVNYDAAGNIHSRIRSLPDGRSTIPGRGRLFTLREISSSMDLSATELVVLSACETGLVGFGGKSDEFVGLPGGFLRVGARNVVASLWVVDDEGTAKLMEYFYTNLFGGKSTPAKALRKAQLEIMRDPRWKNPYYWGAFRAFGV